MTIEAIWDNVGGIAGLVALILLVLKFGSDALTARAKVDDDAIIAKAQAAKLAAETDEVIARASDVMITGMQKRVDALIARVEASECKRDKQDTEITELKKRVDVLENMLIKKDNDIARRDERILELECKVREQAVEIEHLKKQVASLELNTAKKKPQ